MATVELKVQPFLVPNYVILEVAGPHNGHLTGENALPLTNLSAEALAEMCDEFRRSVFARAKKVDPGVSR
jgi:hypothetical protein